MLFDKFAKEVHRLWSTHLNKTQQKIKAGALVASEPATLLYPNMLLISDCGDHYVAEVLGANNSVVGLRTKRSVDESVSRYLSQFDYRSDKPMFQLDSRNIGFQGICFSHHDNWEEVLKRFPQVGNYNTKMINPDAEGSAFSFGEYFEFCTFEDCLVVNRSGNSIRCKSICAALIVTKKVESRTLEFIFERADQQGSLFGISAVRNDRAASLLAAGQLQSMYLYPGFRETTIGEFLRLNPEIVKRAFKTTHFEYEPYLEWLEHDGTCDDTATNPDLMVRREDGFYDIYDLKTAALDRKKITKGERRRRRFIDYVQEGIAQLANYEEYFRYPKNAAHAKQRYGIEIHDPKLVLVVGNWENFDLDEVKQASRLLKNFSLIDYDTLCHFFLSNR